LKSLLPVWDLCLFSTSMFLIFSVVLVCHHITLLIHQPPSSVLFLDPIRFRQIIGAL
jgi:hypothetical protein